MVDLFDYVLNQLEMAVMDGYIPGFQRLIFKSRSLNRGGGIGFYVRSGISTKIIEELSVFQDGIFESICIELGYSTAKVIFFVSIYWLPGSISYLNSVNSEFFNCLKI